jgi:hypothetical protein
VSNGGEKRLGNEHEFESEGMGHFKKGRQSDVTVSTLDSSDLRLRHTEKFAQLDLGHFSSLPLVPKLPYYIEFGIYCHQ